MLRDSSLAISRLNHGRTVTGQHACRATKEITLFCEPDASALNAMLLNEFLKENRQVQDMKAIVAEQQKQIKARGLEESVLAIARTNH
jgi:hypothetical protein